MSTQVKLPDKLGSLRALALPVGIVATVLAVILAFVNESKFDGFAQSYLYAFVLFFGMSLGSFAFLCIHHLTGGSWSYMIQRILEAMMKTIWVPGLGFLVIVFLGAHFGWHSMYDRWMDVGLSATQYQAKHPETMQGVIEGKAWYLNSQFWSIRTIFYWALWGGMIFLFSHWTKQSETTHDGLVQKKFRIFAAPFLILYCLSMTFAPVDWIMSTEPMWFSTMYGPLFWISQGLTILAFVILILSALSDTKPISKYLTVEHYHMTSTLMCGFIVLWTYMSFSQFLIIWAGNQPEEIHYYLARDQGYFKIIIALLMLGHFFLPFMVLLQRVVKFNYRWLKWVCIWMLCFRLVDLFFIIMPAFFEDSHAGFDYVPETPWAAIVQCLVMTLALGGFWMYVFLTNLTKLPLLPMYDPRFHENVGHGAEAHGGEAAEHA